MPPRVSVVVLNWNGIKYTLKCIDSLKKQSFKNFEIIIVDNGSAKDNSVELLKKVKGIRLVLNEKNLGFAGGHNVGAKHSAATDYIAILNNDTTVSGNWLRELVAAMDKHPELGEAESKILNKYYEREYRFDYYGTPTHLLFLTEYDFKVDESKYVPMFSTSGAAMIYRKKLVEQPFDSDYFMYHEDSYLGWLLRLKGYGAAVIPSAEVYHEGEATIKSVKGMSSFFTYLGERNRITNLFIFYSPVTLIKLIPLLLLTTVFINLYDFKKIPVRLKSYLWLLFHIPKIMSKRSKIQAQRKVPDSKITLFMSAKLFEVKYFSNPAAKIIATALNSFSFIYCRLLGIKSVEFNRKEAGFG
ncbi:glycosyltransferase family 2 protein [Candidatus Woesearchaeota archaeon]|nr:glycosyltransferase family 2 protein [Candidatus Woesearchaeota archaeon]